MDATGQEIGHRQWDNINGRNSSLNLIKINVLERGQGTFQQD